MQKKSKPTVVLSRGTGLFPEAPRPDFLDLLKKPKVSQNLPSDFDADLEARHLGGLWDAHIDMRGYEIQQFIHSGASGMVFRVRAVGTQLTWAMKVARSKIYNQDGGAPFSQKEINALRELAHPNIVKLESTLSAKHGVFALVTTYVEDPQSFDEYLTNTLRKSPKGIHSFAPERLERACDFIVQRCAEIASAISHMHEQNLYHGDIKPANILIGKNQQAILTDLGSCISTRDDTPKDKVTVQFTWTYAHPDLRDLGSDPHISGGGLKSSATVNISALGIYDLFALGRSIQEILAALDDEFGERSYSSYSFRFLHLVSALLLDGRNAVSSERIHRRDKRRFVTDSALDYPVEIFRQYKITSALVLVERLQRFGRSFSLNDCVPELDTWQPDYINTGAAGPAPFTDRISTIFSHPAVRRLRSELQLGWMREVYPGATHTRWSHSLGVLAATVEYFNALLSDPEVPTARLLLTKLDIETGIAAAILHDLAQSAFGHDFEAIVPKIYNQKKLLVRLLNDKRWGNALSDLFKADWPDLDVSRVLRILGCDSANGRAPLTPLDYLIRDIIDGPIDADKLDYLVRDATACGVPYGLSIDRFRFLRTLTVCARAHGDGAAIELAYRAKGAAAIEGLLLARYQMYGAVYWHHAYRCIQAMFGHAVAASLAERDSRFLQQVSERIYTYLLCSDGAALTSLLKIRAAERARLQRTAVVLGPMPPSAVAEEPSLALVWCLADDDVRLLIERLASRKLYKRVYEIRVGDLARDTEFAALANNFEGNGRIALAKALAINFVNGIHTEMQQRGPAETVTETHARERLQELEKLGMPIVVVDFPTRGIPEETNLPAEIGDAARKYISGRMRDSARDRNVFRSVRRLQIDVASLRVFAAPEFHELIIRYLPPPQIESCVHSAMPFLGKAPVRT